MTADHLADAVRHEIDELGLDADPVVTHLVEATTAAASTAAQRSVDDARLEPDAAALVVLAPFDRASTLLDRAPDEAEQRAAALSLADRARRVQAARERRAPLVEELSGRQLARLLVSRTLRGRWRRG
jgi:hypothetical protein